MHTNGLRYLNDEDVFSNNEHIFINHVVIKDTTDPHAHTFNEISYITEGSGIHVIEGYEFQFKKGDYFIINCNQMHNYISNSNEPIQMYNLIFKPDFIDTSLSDCVDFASIARYYSVGRCLGFENFSKFNINDQESTMLSLIEIMHREYEAKKTDFILMLRALLTQFLIVTFRNIESHPMIMYKTLNFEALIEYIVSNSSEKLSLKELAAIVHLSPNHFCRKFKSIVGITVTQFIQQVRIDKSKQLLSHSDKKISVIANEIGYDDIKYFESIFKHQIGITPSNFRKTSNKIF